MDARIFLRVNKKKPLCSISIIYTRRAKKKCSEVRISCIFCYFFTISCIFCAFFRIFSNVFECFLNIFKRFRTFSSAFERFFLDYFTQTLQPNLLTPVFRPKTNVAPEKINQKSHFFLNLDNFSPLSLI